MSDWVGIDLRPPLGEDTGIGKWGLARGTRVVGARLVPAACGMSGVRRNGLFEVAPREDVNKAAPVLVPDRM